jgi:hypothetical protein
METSSSDPPRFHHPITISPKTSAAYGPSGIYVLENGDIYLVRRTIFAAARLARTGALSRFDFDANETGESPTIMALKRPKAGDSDLFVPIEMGESARQGDAGEPPSAPVR